MGAGRQQAGRQLIPDGMPVVFTALDELSQSKATSLS